LALAVLDGTIPGNDKVMRGCCLSRLPIEKLMSKNIYRKDAEAQRSAKVELKLYIK
jgi:hypothetical protein